MTAPARAPGSAASGLLGTLMARSAANSAATCWNSPPRTRCSAPAAAGWPDANGTARGQGLCQGHLQRWVDAGPPGPGRVRRDDRSAVAPATAQPTVPGRRLRLRGCPRGMCELHAQRWERAGRPDLRRLAGRPAAGRRGPPGRVLPDPALRAVAAGDVAVLPRSTPTPGRSTGDPTSTSSSGASPRSRHPADEIIRLDLLGPQLKLEMQYVLQRRHDERHGKLTPAVVNAGCGSWPQRAGDVAARPRRGHLA